MSKAPYPMQPGDGVASDRRKARDQVMVTKSKATRAPRFAKGTAVTVWQGAFPVRRGVVVKSSTRGIVLDDGSEWDHEGIGVGSERQSRLRSTDIADENTATLRGVQWSTVPDAVIADVVAVLERAWVWPLKGAAHVIAERVSEAVPGVTAVARDASTVTLTATAERKPAAIAPGVKVRTADSLVNPRGLARHAGALAVGTRRPAADGIVVRPVVSKPGAWYVKHDDSAQLTAYVEAELTPLSVPVAKEPPTPRAKKARAGR